ncbi:putative alpha/beta hydrolase [Tothia fuscella]|uniref:Alpha/beta hydrolase n=1 Tax=Tothia fuscella TaxID=1048955 RepID=A0A9P4NTI4_9PEZI|nr:putative alpha/beta hydrolase [Tothia fuscella]
MAPQPGILYVTMAPQPSLTPAQFHDWYQNEHAPGRLRLPYIFINGFRYKATDGESPEWMAIYDVTDMEYLTKDVYTSLRKEPKQSQREKDTMKQIKVGRKFYDLVSSKESRDFKNLEDVKYEGVESNVMIAVFVTLKDPSKKDEVDKWYEEEHISMLSRVPGWRRSRRFITSHLEPLSPEETEYVSLHEYAPDNGLGGEEFKSATSTPWRTEVFDKLIGNKKRRAYSLYYTFGPAPRDLASPSDPSAVPYHSDFHRTATYPVKDNGRAAIESYIMTPDGVALPYRLEGSIDVQAPLIVLCNSILVDYGIWDAFIDSFSSKEENKKFRIVRYNARGRYSDCGDAAVTVDLLAQDIITILDALRVPKAAAVIGVSLGGATALNTALQFPDRVSSFIACDTNSLAPPGNPKAWGERIDMAEKQGSTASSGEPVVGDELAEFTVRRWFVKESYDDPPLAKEAERVKSMVANNSLKGFKTGVKALYKYDFRDEMKNAKVRGAFVVGGGDGVLPKTMKDMKDGYGDGSAVFEIIDGAGHLPMVEKPQEFAEVVTKFLGSA